MGVYLSSPCVDFAPESGVGYKLKYTVGDIQGWRKNMEDAHIACTDLAMIDAEKNDDCISVFAVFDGHGGKEVAKCCQLYFLRELVKTEEFYRREFAQALIKNFHRMDEILEDKSYDYELQQFRKLPNPSDYKGRGGDDGDDDERRTPGNSVVSFFNDLMEKEENNRKLQSNRNLLRPLDPNIDSKPIEVPTTLAISTLLEDGSSPRVMGSSQYCTLNDHRVIAGCTSVVALKYGNSLFVANAGDSRSVLCRADGSAYALSEDHKPNDKVELDRIQAAGGFVNGVGRINGNLNLSRAIGDLKYKQNPNVRKEQQMITAEPDVSVTTLLPDDKFFVLACDGVWDCFSNQGICDFINERKAKDLSLEDILREIFTFCVSRDPKDTGGVGGDNMTCVIVELLGDAPQAN